MPLSLENYEIESLVAVSREQYKNQIEAFVAHRAIAMESASWLDSIKPTETALSASSLPHQLSGPEDFSSHFTPFVQKKIVPHDAKVFVVGDIHGDIAVLLESLAHLKAYGYLDAAHHIMRDNVYLVFLGDYTNRGSCGVPVVSVLLDLFMKNPDHVFLLRGNHESASSNMRFFQRHHIPTTEYAAVPFLQELAQRFDGYQYPDLLLWYDYLPLVLYLGTKNENGGVDYLTFCHGGLEIGYNPKDFLACSDDEFAMITKLDRKQALDALAGHDDTKHVADQVVRALAIQGNDGCSRYQALHNREDSIDVQAHVQHVTLRLGMLWNNFVTENNAELEFALSPTRWTLYFGRAVTQYLLAQAESSTVRVHGILRGHQHLDEAILQLGLDSMMLTLIKEGKGLVKQWDGMVYTLGASDNITGFHSFLMLTLGQQPAFWSVRHYFKKPDQKDFSFHMTKMF